MDIFKKILKIIYNLLFVLLIIVASFIILTSYKIIKGYNFYVVMSGSMEPKIHTGSIVGVKEEDNYEKGQIITIQMKNDPNQTYTHRIVDVNTTEDIITYTTKGDANEDTDPDIALKTNVLGRVFVSIPVIGYIIHFSKQPLGFILMVGVPTVIIISSEINTVKDYVKGRIQEKNIKQKKRKINSKKKKK